MLAFLGPFHTDAQIAVSRPLTESPQSIQPDSEKAQL